MATRGLPDDASDPADVLAARALAQARPFLDAMSDPGNYGMSKSIFAAMGIGEEDLFDDEGSLDPRTVEKVMTEFNALPFDERSQILGVAQGVLGDAGDGELGPGPGARLASGIPDNFRLLPLRVAPSGDGLAALSVEVPLCQKVEGLRRGLGQRGIKLTKAGNPTLADGRRLVADLGLGDKVDGIRSSLELRELIGLVRVALEAGAVRFREGRLQPVAKWDRQPAAARWERLVAAVLQEGPASLHFGGYMPQPHHLADMADEMSLVALAMLWLAEDPVPADAFVGMLETAADDAVASGMLGVAGRHIDVQKTSIRRVDDVFRRWPRPGWSGGSTDRWPSHLPAPGRS